MFDSFRSVVFVSTVPRALLDPTFESRDPGLVALGRVLDWREVSVSLTVARTELEEESK